MIELARAGTKVKQLAATFQMSDATIYNWLKQDRIDSGEAEGASTNQQLELNAARRRIRQLETELAVARKVNEVFLAEGVSPKGFPGDRGADRAGHQRAAGVHQPGGISVGLLRVERPPSAISPASQVHKASAGTYSAGACVANRGALRITAELRHGRGVYAGHNAVGDIMRRLGLKGLPIRRLPRGLRVSKFMSLDLVGRVFARIGRTSCG